MIIAIPVKTKKPDAAVAPLFGKAKQFALVDTETGETTLWDNELESGRAVAEHFGATGVEAVVVQEMGANPFLLLKNRNIRVFFAGKERITLPEAVEAWKAGKLTEITPENMGSFLKEGTHQHGHDHGHHH